MTSKLWNDYMNYKQIYEELGEKYKKHIIIISKHLENYKVKINVIKPQSTVLIIDTTYFGRSFGIMVFRSYELKKNLLQKEVKWETLEEYKSWIQQLENEGWIIKAIVCDGKEGLLNMKRPAQMCIFYQKAILRRYLTKSPILEPNKELKEIGSVIGDIRKDTL